MSSVWKNSDRLTGLGLTLWYTWLGFEKYSNYVIAHGLILWYIGLGLEKCLDYLTGVRLILSYIGFGLTLLVLFINWTWIEELTKKRMPLEKYEDFL